MIQIVALGQYGGSIIDDTSTHVGKWHSISMITDTVFSAWEPSFDIYGTLAGITFPAGFILFGNFTSITLASGKIVAYKGTWNQ
jgi:hypothetical protein